MGYGDLVLDPGGLIDLPKEFQYRVTSPKGSPLSSGGTVLGPTNSGFAARARMQMGAALEPADVARSTLKALGSTSTVLPGALSKLLAYSLVPLPKWVRVRIMAGVMSSMTKQGKTRAIGVP